MTEVSLYLVVIAVLTLWVETDISFTKKDPAEELEEWLKNFGSDLADKGQLPQYKFYTGILETLLNLARKMGGNYQEPILFLREGLRVDRQFEKKLRELILGCWFQMLFVVLLTWAFIFGATTMVEVKVDLMNLSFIAAWQVLGIVILPFAISYYRKTFFGDIGKLWRMLYVLTSLARVPLARSEIFKLAGIPELEQVQTKSLSHLRDKLGHLCREALKQGGSYEYEIRTLMDELRFQEKWHAELFEKRLTVIKLGLLAVFFLPSYLGFIFILIGDLITLI